MTDTYQLQRFIDAQSGTFEAALAEIRNGRKTSHWMWFVFPQIAGLGQSAMARHYAIGTLDEARAYLAHPVLGARLHACMDALEGLSETSAERVFGQIDAIKLRSSLTLFAEASQDPAFSAALRRWFNGPDERTLELLNATP